MSKLPRLRRFANSTRSPVTPPSMKTTLPSTCATPMPSWSIDSMKASFTPALLALRRGRGEHLALDLLGHLHAVHAVGEGRGVAAGEVEGHGAHRGRRIGA